MHPDVCPKTFISICLTVPVGEDFIHSMAELIYCILALQAKMHNMHLNHTGKWNIETQVCTGKCIHQC